MILCCLQLRRKDAVFTDKTGHWIIQKLKALQHLSALLSAQGRRGASQNGLQTTYHPLQNAISLMPEFVFKGRIFFGRLFGERKKSNTTILGVGAPFEARQRVTLEPQFTCGLHLKRLAINRPDNDRLFRHDLLEIRAFIHFSGVQFSAEID